MNARIMNIKTKDGAAPCQFFAPPRPGPAPAVIFYMDGIGIRPALGEVSNTALLSMIPPSMTGAAYERHWQQIRRLFAGKLLSSQESGNR
jgi:hypothetical protein